jgi:hypothetical protein
MGGGQADAGLIAPCSRLDRAWRRGCLAQGLCLSVSGSISA